LSENQSNIQINIDASDITQLLGILSNLQRKLEGAQDEFDGLGDEARTAGRKVKGAGKDAGKAGGKMAGLATKVGAMAAGFIAAAVTVEAMKKGFELLKASVEAAAEANTIVAASVDVTSGAFTGMQVAIGEAITTGETGNAIMGTLTGVFDMLKETVDRNKDAIANFVRRGLDLALGGFQLLINIMGPVARLFNNMLVFIPLTKLAIIGLSTAYLQFQTVLAEGVLVVMQKAIESFISLVQVASATAEFFGLDFATEALAGIEGFAEGLGTGN
jgi:hypothetical protein